MNFRLILASVFLVWSNAYAEKKEVSFKNSEGCFNVFIDEPAGNTLTCEHQPKIEYKLTDCSSKKVLENASVEAHVHCVDNDHFKLEFRTTKGVVTANLDVRRDDKGRKGHVVSYSVHESSFSKKSPQNH